MKKILFILLITYPNFCLGQNLNIEFKNQIKELIISIRKELPLNEPNKFIKKSEYFIFDLTLSSNGDLKNLDILRRDNSNNIDLIRPILSVIKKKWKPIKCHYYKIFIPLILTFELEDVDGNIIDENGTYGIDYFFKYLKNKNNKFFVTERISIYFSEPKR